MFLAVLGREPPPIRASHSAVLVHRFLATSNRAVCPVGTVFRVSRFDTPDVLRTVQNGDPIQVAMRQQ